MSGLEKAVLNDRIPENCAFSKQNRFESLYSPMIPPYDGPRTSRQLNGGLIVLFPSKESMDSILDFMDSSPLIATTQFPDQDILAEVFRGRWQTLPWWTNGLKTLRAVHPEVWADTEVRLIHYM